MRSDFTLFEDFVYLPTEPFDTIMLRYRGKNDILYHLERNECWLKHTRYPDECPPTTEIEGGHFYLTTEEGATALCDDIHEKLMSLMLEKWAVYL